MRGVDLLDRFISQSTMHEKIWYWPLFLNCLQMLLVASWRIYCAVSQQKQLDLLDFTRSVVVGILNKPKPCSSGPSGIKFLTNFGSLYPVPAEKQGRCAFCKRNSRRKCLGCNVLLHLLCFYEYHKQL